MPDKVYRTAIYCRLSREDGDKVESNSIASQRAICEDYIARHEDLELVCEPFVDDGYSGVSFNRPQFKSWKRQSARVRLTALWSKISAASQETTSTADVTLRRYSRSSAYASSQSMMRMTV